MKRMLSLFLAVTLAAPWATAPAAHAGPPRTAKPSLPKLGKLRPDALTLIELLDEFTRQDSPTSGAVIVKGSRNEFRAVVTCVTADVSKGKSSSNWRGEVAVTVTVPCDVHYAVDWTRLGPEDVSIDLSRKALRIRLPPLEAAYAEPKMKECRTSASYGGGRFAFADSDVALRLENDLLKEDFVAAAKEEAGAHASAARDQARKRLVDFFAWRGIKAEIE